MILLDQLIGAETSLPEAARAIRDLAVSFNVPCAGAYHVMCSDETEWECAEAFQAVLAEPLLPSLKPDRRVAFHTMNLGARYEPGAIFVAEHHYATLDSKNATVLMVVKINSHVAVHVTPDGIHYGSLSRYGVESNCCGALHALLHDGAIPTVNKLRETFAAGGVDRVAILRDEQLIAPEHRALFAAVTNARLQASRVVDDVADHAPDVPTIFLVVPCVTLNRPGPDTELVVGRCLIDYTDGNLAVQYRGLGDMPSNYRLVHDGERTIVEDDQWPDRE